MLLGYRSERPRIPARLRRWVGVLALPLFWGAADSAPAPEAVSFSRQILPVLSDKCFYCHGPDEKHRKADLRLDRESDARAQRKRGAAVVPGKPQDSLLLARILSKDADEVMPPPSAHKELSPTEKSTIRRWIEEGARWGQHWAFSPLERPTLPPGYANPIDALVAARLHREGLTFSPEADPRTLLRRLTLDLTGLPPTDAEMDAWLADSSAEAWERQVDRLLASPAYGERMAWEWMEAARYADTNGYQGDNTRTMWPWRDWVVRAFNRNMPWDEFTVWQLAGDLLPGATEEQRLATGFLRNHPINGEGGRISAENRVDYVMDMTETTGTVWLGLTMNCCRCHDHKFDPATQRDYYSLFAFFNQTPVDGGGGDGQTPPVLVVPTGKQKDAFSALELNLPQKREALKAGRLSSIPRRKEWETKTLLTASNQVPWETLKIEGAKAKSSTLTVQPDQSVLASGANPANDDFEVTARPGQGRWAGIRLDALRHSSLRHESVSRVESGNFVLTTFRVERQDGKSPGQDIPMTAVAATFEQGDLKLATVLDEDKNTGWGVWDSRIVDQSHAAVLRFKSPVDCDTNTVLVVRLRHESKNAQHVLGRFRLSLTQASDPALSVADSELLHAMRQPEESRTALQKENIALRWEETDDALKTLRREINALETQRREIVASAPKVMIMADQASLRETHVLDHGLYNKPLAAVTAATPAFLPPMAAGQPTNRLGLARWIVAPENPLPARVTVNRFWQSLMGVGLVKTSEDFGVQAEFPPQSELLDWLATEFRDSGWNVKRLLRLIVTSRTWKQSSAITPQLAERDPFNRLLTRGARFRMPSWMIRDQALAASGLLRPMDGGAPVKPWQPEGVWEEASFGNLKYARSTGEDLHRRSLYTFWRRIVGPTAFFDTGSRLVCSVKPLRTNTPLQALATCNDITYVEAARALAQSAAGIPDTEERLAAMMRRVLGRSPQEEETYVLISGMKRSRAHFEAAPEKARAFLSEGENVPAAKDQTPELAAWTVTALTLLNLDETLNRH